MNTEISCQTCERQRYIMLSKTENDKGIQWNAMLHRWGSQWNELNQSFYEMKLDCKTWWEHCLKRCFNYVFFTSAPTSTVHKKWPTVLWPFDLGVDVPVQAAPDRGVLQRDRFRPQHGHVPEHSSQRPHQCVGQGLCGPGKILAPLKLMLICLFLVLNSILDNIHCEWIEVRRDFFLVSSASVDTNLVTFIQ